MASIKILDQTYTLPAILTEHFCALQDQVQARQQIIQTGLRPQPRLLGVIPRRHLTLTPEERWQELDLLVRNYSDIIAELYTSKNAYAALFGQLAAGVQQALVRQSEAMRREEEERLADAQRPETQQDETLQRLVHEDGERLLSGVRLLGQAALLLLKKIDLCQKGLARLVEDQDLQQRVLAALTGRLELHRRAYLRRQRIDLLVQDAARMAEVALHFEEYMRDHLGPLQNLLEQVVHVESDLHRTVAEIEDLTRELMQQHCLTPLPGGEMLNELWLKFLTAIHLKKDCLVEMWERLERQDDTFVLDVELANASNVASPVLTALDNIRTLVEVRLAPIVSEHTMTELAPSQAVPIPVFVDAEKLGKCITDKFGNLADVYIGQAIPKKKLENARRSCNVPKYEAISILIDATVFGSAKYALLVGNWALYLRNDWAGKPPGSFTVPWSEFLDIEVSSINAHKVRVGYSTSFSISGSQIKSEQLVGILQFLQQTVRELTANTTKEPSDSGREIADD